MIVWLEGCTTAVNVALVAVPGATGIMRPCAAYEGCRGVAEVAIQSGGNVCGVGFGIHADRCTAVMTGRAIVDDAGVIEYRAGKSQRQTGVVTDAAILVGLYMGVRFTGSEGAIVTGSAVIHDTRMRKCPGYKACGDMALAAITVGWYMVGRWYFPSGCCAVMA